MMRKILIIALVPVFVVVLAAIIVLLMPLDSFRAPLEKAVSRGLGRGVHIAGGLHASLYPEIGLSAGDVSIDNVSGGEAKLFAHVDTMAVGAKLLPLLSRQIHITRLALDHPSINLEVDKNGTGNWNFGTGQSESNASSPDQLSISGLRIQGGEISYFDMRTGKRKQVSDANASLQLEALERPAMFDLDAVYDKEKLTVTGNIDNPQAFMRKKPAKLALELKSASLNLKFDGSVTGASQSSGTVTMSGPSLRQLMQRAGTAAPKNSGMGAFSLSGGVSSQDRVYALKQAKLTLDGMKANLDLSVDMNGTVPLLKGSIALDRLDAAAYMLDNKQAAQTKGWSTEPLSLTGLKLADADLAITAGRFLLGNFVITQGEMHVVLHDGKLSADLTRAALFGGSATGLVTADGSGTLPAVTVRLDVKSVAMKSLLQSAIKVERIEGTGAMAVNVAGIGKSQQAIMNSLGGTASVAVRNGAIRGVDLAAVARTVQNPLSGVIGAATSGRASTDFAEAGGSFTIKSGMAHNQDFHLLNPFVRISGSGDIDLGQRTINFRIEPKLVANAQGQGGLLGGSGLGVPFQITGPWTKPSYRPDLTKAVGNLLMNQVQSGAGPVGGLLGNVLGGKKGSDSKPQRGLDLKSLFGR
jgi:AsmA protein